MFSLSPFIVYLVLSFDLVFLSVTNVKSALFFSKDYSQNHHFSHCMNSDSFIWNILFDFIVLSFELITLECIVWVYIWFGNEMYWCPFKRHLTLDAFSPLSVNAKIIWDVSWLAEPSFERSYRMHVYWF